MAWYHVLLFLLIVFGLFLSVLYSIRHRRQTDSRLRGLYAARMNMSMGLLLVSIALVQLLVFEMNWVRLILGTVFLLLGLFNFFAGAKNHSIYNTLPK